MSVYGKFLRSVRQSRGLSQLVVGEITGIAQSRISAYENDRQIPSIDIVNKIVVGCGYQLKAVAGPDVIDVPLAKGGWTPLEWVPERDPDDPPESGASMRWDAPMDERLEAIGHVLDSPLEEVPAG